MDVGTGHLSIVLVCLRRVWGQKAVVNQVLCNFVQVGPYLLEKRTKEKLIVSISADKAFLHGAGPSFDQLYQAGSGVSLKLMGTVSSRAYVMSSIIKSKFNNNVMCNFSFDSNGTVHWKVQQLQCVY